MSISILSTVGIILLTPLILLIVTFLAVLAVITSTITSSFLLIRLTLLAVEMIGGITLESTNWLLSACIQRIRCFLSDQNDIPPTNCHESLLSRRKLPSSSLSLSQLPFKATLKTKYSMSIPNTPEAESFHI
ncbi:hypothetical protein BDB01DRAFT_809045 [Pilobolus umbonatus]|nr:hypothetical protein BDB01DRAFT_809045 [Pilobolus umbonatus]